jgi:class 3 adenylate cyclase
LAMGLVLWLNHRGRYGLAAGLLVVFMQLAIVGQAWMLGPDSGVHFWLLPIVLIPHLLVANPRQNTWFAGHSLLSTLLFCGIVFWQVHKHEATQDQAFAYASVVWALFAMGYYGRKLNDAWAGKERQAVVREKAHVQQATQHREQLERAMASQIETEQKLVEHLFKVSGLNEFSEKLSEANTESEVLELAAAQAARITGSEWVEVALLDASETSFNCFVLDSKEGLIATGWKAAITKRTLAGDKVILLSNARREKEDERRPSLTERGLQSVVVLPMQAGPTMVGVLTAADRWPDHLDRLGYLVAQQFAAVLGTHIGLRRALGHLESSLDVSDALLVNVLPKSVANRMKQGEKQIADRIDEAAVLFCDLAGFTSFSSDVPPEQVVALLQQVFGIMEGECAVHGVEKIKTIGDSFMAAAGVTVAVDDAAHAMASYAFSVASQLKELGTSDEPSLGFRMGIHIGPVVAGVIGAHRLFFDVWGDTVNMASRMESNGVVGEVSCSNEVREALADRWNFERLGLVAIKGKGEQVMWLLKGPKKASEPATQSTDRLPSTSSEESTSA